MSNLVVNGSFMTGDFTGWNGSGTLSNEVDENSYFAGYEGLNTAIIGNTESHNIIQQTISVSQGILYQISYVLKNDGGDPVQYFACTLDGGDTVIPDSVISLTDGTLPAIDWTIFSFMFIANSSSINLGFITQQDPAYFYLTKIELIAIEPLPPSRPRLQIPAFTNNAQVYYKPHSLASGGVGSVRNNRHKARYT
jgi:hypothetical protein